MAIGGLAVAATFLLPHEPTPWVYLIAALAGFGFAANWVFPWSMVPDVVDVDRLATGEQRSGMYYGVWGLGTKASEALAIASTGWILALFHYVPNVVQTPQTLFGIRLFFGLIPALAIALALPLLIWYPITRETHNDVMAKLESGGGT
jgi:GPH family glycoside/pentoside/hexuronide:cation symporter